MNKKCFHFLKNGEPRTQATALKSKNIFVLEIIRVVTESGYTKEQQVLTLCNVMKHKKIRPIGVSAGIVVPGFNYNTEKYVMKNIRASIKTARKTNNRRGISVLLFSPSCLLL